MSENLADELDPDADALPPLGIVFDRRRPAGDQIYEALRRAIVSLRLAPGASISENRICRQIGVSRTPVRAALIRLVEDGLIEVYPQKGSIVAPIKLSAVRDNHFIRKALELAVLDRTAQAWTDALSARSHEIVAQQEAALARQEFDGFHGLDEAFHGAFCAAAGLQGVWSTILIAKARVDRVHRLAAIEGRLNQVVVEHRDILAALDAGDAKRARERLDYHLERAPSIMQSLIGVYEKYFVD
jgi:DNA-binding GntR family transcriptional regulator